MTLFGLPEISYDRILTNEYSVGISLTYSALGKENYGTTYMITPNFRLFFGKNRAKGFFMEANASLFEERVRKSDYYYYEYSYDSYYTSHTTKYTNFGLGMAAGYKLISSSRWVGKEFP